MRCVLLGRQFREEAEENVEDDGREASGSEEPSQVARSRRRAQRRGQFDQSDSCPSPRSIPFDELDCRPIIYHPGGIFEELPPLPREVLRDPRIQSWRNVFSSCSSSETVKKLLREVPRHFPYSICRAAPVVTSGRISMYGYLDEREGVQELTFTKAEPNGIFSVKIRANYNVLTGHPNKTQDWQRAYFYVKSDEHAFEELLRGRILSLLWNPLLVRHPNTIAYPEKFFENAQLIATHSHLRWPDLSREWIRRQQARIARGKDAFSSPSAVDWESRLPCVLGTRKSRLSLFTQKQQKLLDKAREMEGIPDLSALLRGKLQMLSSKSSSAGTSEVGPTRADGDANSEPPARSPPKERATKSKKQSQKEQPSPLEGNVPLEMAPSSADASEVAAKKKKKKKDGKKRSREETSIEHAGTSAAIGSDDAGRLDPIDSTRGSSEERPKKKARKTAAGDEGRRDGTPVPEDPSKSGGRTSETGGGSRDGYLSSKRAPSSSARRKDGESRGSLPQMSGRGFPDRVEFLYDERTPLVLNPLQCAELTRQIHGGTKELPPLDDLYFKKEYIDAAVASKRSDGSMNYLVEKYDSTLKQTMVQLGASEKLARTRLSVIERLRAENKKAGDQAAKEKEVLRVKFEELKDKLKSDRLAKKDALREKTRLEWLLEEERGAVVGTLIKERQRLRDSRVQEVTRERIKVQTAMADKSTRCIDSGTEIPQSMIDIFSEQEKVHEAEVAKLRLEPFSEDDFALSPQPPFSICNVGLIGRESASRLITSREATDDPVDEPMIDITSALSERIVVRRKAAEASSPALIEETVRNLSASDPPAQAEGLDAQAVEEETAEPLDPSRDDQDIVV
ncbi:hypothetical protein Bca52824_053164 [Brassica carinata]|uniref:Uncharacterized protein n=1 Tax=Brassica carinata TaxID=52824 RepID=A0A8X7R3P2_BRACI|nr:hypothetical protein Bca52824_053164 [Brassica carinata]